MPGIIIQPTRHMEITQQEHTFHSYDGGTKCIKQFQN